jgi:hypothetical protein
MLRPPLRYVALGDSYSIGTGVAAAERWPEQLVARLGAPGVGDPALELVANLAVNGWTSAGVIRGELPRLWSLQPAFVTLLIGVNDVVQGVPFDAYRRNVATILDALLARLPAEARLHRHPRGRRLRRSGTPGGRDPGHQRGHGRAVSGLGHRPRGHPRSLAQRGRRPSAGRRRRPPSQWSAVRPVGRPDRSGRRGAPRPSRPAPTVDTFD